MKQSFQGLLRTHFPLINFSDEVSTVLISSIKLSKENKYASPAASLAMTPKSPMNILTLETSTRKFSLAVSRDEKILVSKSMVLNGVLSSSIIPAIDKLLKSAGLPLSDIHGFTIGLGPGSFTSLRVGLSTVKALNLATGKPVVGIASLDALALGVLSQTQAPICTLCDARRNLVYSCFYQNTDFHKSNVVVSTASARPLGRKNRAINIAKDCNKGSLQRTSDYFLISIKDLAKKIDKEVLFVGDGIKLFREEILKLMAGRGDFKVHFAGEKFWYPQAKHLAALAGDRFKLKKYDNPDRLVPLYLYPDDCQVTR